MVRTNNELGKAISQTDILLFWKCPHGFVLAIQYSQNVSCLYSVSAFSTSIYKYLMTNNCTCQMVSWKPLAGIIQVMKENDFVE